MQCVMCPREDCRRQPHCATCSGPEPEPWEVEQDVEWFRWWTWHLEQWLQKCQECKGEGICKE